MFKKTLISLAFVASLPTLASANESSLPPGCPTIQATAQHVSCYGGFNGVATITLVVPSSGPYTYTWSNGFVESGPQTTLSLIHI